MARKTIKLTLKLSTADITALSKGVFGEAAARGALIETLKRTGGNTVDNRAVIIGARMAMHPLAFPGSNLKPAVLAKMAADLVLKGGMSEGQLKAYGAGRQYWSQLLISAGLKAVDNRGGANNPAGGAAKPDRTKKGQGAAKPETKPETKADDSETVALSQGPREFYRQLAALAFGYSKNRPKLSPEFKALSKAIVDTIGAALDK